MRYSSYIMSNLHPIEGRLQDIKLEDILNNPGLNRIYSQIIEEPLLAKENKKKLFDDGIESLKSSNEGLLNYLKLSQKMIKNLSKEEKILHENLILSDLPNVHDLSQVVSEDYLNLVGDILTNLSKRRMQAFTMESYLIEMITRPFLKNDFLKDKQLIGRYLTLINDFTDGEFNANVSRVMESIPLLLNSDVEPPLLKKYIGYMKQIDRQYNSAQKFSTGIDFLAMPLIDKEIAEEMSFENKFNEINLDLYYSVTSDFLKKDINYGEIVMRDLSTIIQLRENHIDDYVNFMHNLMNYSEDNVLNGVRDISHNFYKLKEDIIPQFVDDVIFSTKMLGYLDQEFVDGYMRLLLGEDLPIEQKTRTEKTLELILDQRQIIKEAKEEVYKSLYKQQKRFNEEKIKEGRVWDISQLSRLWYKGRQKAEAILKAIEPKDNSTLVGFINRVIDDYKRKIQQKHLEAGIESEPFNLNLIDLGCGDGTKAIEIIKSLKEKVDNINLRLVDNSKEMLNKARINAYLNGLESDIFEYNLEDLIDSRIIEHSPFFSSGDSPLRYRILEPEVDFKQLKFVPTGRIDCRSILDQRDSSRFKEISPVVYLFLGQTLGNFSDTNGLLSSLISLLNPSDLIVIEVDVRKDFEKYLKSEEFMKLFLLDLGLNPDLILDELGKSSYEIILHSGRDNSNVLEAYFSLNSDVILTNNKDLIFKEGDKIKVGFSKEFNPSYFRNYFQGVCEPISIIHQNSMTADSVFLCNSNISHLYKNHLFKSDSKLFVCYAGMGLINIPKQIEKIRYTEKIQNKYLFFDREKIEGKLGLLGLDPLDYRVQGVSSKQEYVGVYLMARDKDLSFGGKSFKLKKGETICFYDNGKIKVKDSDLYKRYKINPFRKRK